MTRLLDRRLLASAIEYAAQAKLDGSEWDRFFVNHYQDKMMEDARRETVRLLETDSRSVPPAIQQQLCDIAQRLRKS